MSVSNSHLRPSYPMLLGISLAVLASGCIAGEDDFVDEDLVEEGSAGGEGLEIGEASSAIGAVYSVGPTRSYKTLGAVAGLLQPGDVVEIDGNATYAGGVALNRSGTASSKITIRGIRVSGKRPVLSGGTSTLDVNADHYVIEGLDITGGSSRCVFHHGHDITLRDSVVHHCPGHGVLGADSDSGSLTMEYVEVHNSGSGTTRHPVYIATDESAHPGSVFRMRHCYVHDGLGGNNVKTRAERNEITYNWIEGGMYKELELIGPDGQDPELAREDSDVVGNVFRKTTTQFVVRVGGDGTGDTNGRYRFVNNTFLLMQGSSAAIHAFDGVDSIEMHNNVFHRVGGGGVQIVRDDASWASGGPVIKGTNNAVPPSSTLPGGWSGTVTTSSPGFADLANRDVRLLSSSPLRDAGVAVTSSPSGHAFPSPLALPLFMPPLGTIGAVGSALQRTSVGAVDIGAYEYGTAETTTPPVITEPAPSSCAVSPAGVWDNNPLPSAQTGTFTARWDVTPSASGIDGTVGLSQGPETAWSGLATIVLFDAAGRIYARNGSAYQAATTMYYSGGQTYKIRMVVDVPNKRYSVYVQAPGGTETLLASQYAFRTEQASVTSLDNWASIQADGTAATLAACSFTLQ